MLPTAVSQKACRTIRHSASGVTEADRAGGRRKRGRAEFLRNPLESERDNYTVESESASQKHTKGGMTEGGEEGRSCRGGGRGEEEERKRSETRPGVSWSSGLIKSRILFWISLKGQCGTLTSGQMFISCSSVLNVSEVKRKKSETILPKLLLKVRRDPPAQNQTPRCEKARQE